MQIIMDRKMILHRTESRKIHIQWNLGIWDTRETVKTGLISQIYCYAALIPRLSLFLRWS